MEDLVLQPKSVKIKLIGLLDGVLDLRANIKQRKESSTRFTKPVIEPKTELEKRDEPGAPLKCESNSIMSKNPVKSSNKFRMTLV